jgi:hypothetical protein
MGGVFTAYGCGSEPNGLVYRPQAWLMVAGNEQLELRRKLKEVLPHEASRYFIAPGQGLDLIDGKTVNPCRLNFLTMPSLIRGRQFANDRFRRSVVCFFRLGRLYGALTSMDAKHTAG